MAKSLFASALQNILDNTGLYTRKEWANFLLVPVREIDKWIEDRELPQPFQLNLILDFLKLSNVIDKDKYISKLIDVLKSPVKLVTPLYLQIDNKTLLDYIGHYND